MDSYSEIRRVRHAMSAAAGHDIRKLIATINERRPEVAHRIIDPGTKAEQCDVRADWQGLIDKRGEIPRG